MPLAPNQQLFEYRIMRVLGQGAFGTVYLAHDTLLDRPVAIKELTLTAQTDEVAFKRFLQEARAAGGLNHPHVVTVYALKVVESNVYLVMEYLAGGSLRGLLEERSPLPVEKAVRIAADVCEGLAAAHAKSIVHRDVKPENILLTEDGRAKVGDFGIVHVPRGAGGTSLTQAGFQPGTLVCMSPEQIRGRPVDGRSDVYQVGALLYEMLTGHHYVDLGALEQRARDTAGSNVMLFQARLLELLDGAICKRKPEGVCQVRPGVPRWVGEVVVASLAKRVGERPTAEMLTQRLVGGGISLLDQVERPSPSNAEMAQDHVNRGVAYVEEEQWEEAIREYQDALRINPDCAEAHHKLGLAYYHQRRGDDAAREYQAALRINPRNVQVRLDLGEVYEFLSSQPDNAIREYEAALRIDPDSRIAYLRLSHHQDYLGDQNIRLHKAWLHTHPNDAKAHCYLGECHAKQGRWNKAVREFQIALRIEPDNAELHYDVVSAYEDQGRLDEAICEYEAALRVNPDDAIAHLTLGAVYSRQGRWDESTREYEAALRINPDSAEAHCDLGIAYDRRGRLDDALREWLTALRINPDHRASQLFLDATYGEYEGHWEDFIRKLQTAMHTTPNIAQAHFLLGQAYWEQGRMDAAIVEYQVALRINPSYAEAHHNLGVAYAMQGRLAQATHEANLALQLGHEPARELLAMLGQS